MKIELTNDEALMAVYALKEMATRRYEQAAERKEALPHLRKEADAHVLLSNKILNGIPRAKS